VSETSVIAATGRGWPAWFSALDRAGARELDHRGIARLLASHHGLTSWWSQAISVEYERARGLRTRHQRAGGFAVAITKTVAVALPELYLAAADATHRKRWFPRGTFTPSSQTQNKYLRGSWKKHSRLAVGFYAKGVGKSQIAVQVARLARPADVEPERAAWKTALAKLRRILEA
jgi:hypothetical protein